MATDVLDEHRFKTQCNLYESPHVQLTNDSIHRPSTTVLNTPNNNRRVKYSTQSNISSAPSSMNSIRHRHSPSMDILSFFRSLAMKPFKTSSMTNSIAGGQTSNVIGDSYIHHKPPVNLLRVRPLSDVLTDHASYTQSTHTIEEFLKRMGWTGSLTSDESRVKWNTAIKFLIPAKFDVHRAIDLYRTHENLRRTENLDRIWINNPHLVREIQSSKFFSLTQIPNQPLTVVFTASNHQNFTLNGSLSPQDRELITLQALICQLDVATESIEVQQNGLNFIYDMQNCSASQFDVNLSKKILKFLQGSYPAMVKNIFIVSAPKWFRVVYKVTLYSVDQMREYLSSQYDYSIDNIPISLGGTFNPIISGNIRYQICLSKVTNNQSICYPYYSLEYQPITTKSTTGMSSPSSLFAFVSSKRNHDSLPAQIRIRKRESSPSSDNDKRRRSNESLIEEEIPITNSSFLLRKENIADELKQNENSYCLYAGQQEKRNSMDENEYREVKRDIKRTITTPLYKPLTEDEFLSKSHADIRQEFRKMPNPPAKDTHAAKDEKNIEKSRYRDVIPGELTRVKLQSDIDDKSDFINANYVSGYNNEEKAYIFTQGPLQTTVKDFWRMIWQEEISIIVMTTNIRESGTIKCFTYWPTETKEYMNYGSYQIENEKSDIYDSFLITTLILKKKNHSDIRTIYHAHYLKWPDHGIPSGTKDALLFLEKVEYLKELTMTKAPVLLHCSAGIGRTGTFCAIDIGIKQYLNEKLIDIPSTVVKMRHERAGSVQTEDQYLFAYLALMDFIKQYRQQTMKNNLLDLDQINIASKLHDSSEVKTLSDSSIEHTSLIPSIKKNL